MERRTDQPEPVGSGLTVVQAMNAVMADVQAVGKTGHNESQNYNFRGVDQVVNAVGPAFRAHGIVPLPRVLWKEFSTVEVGKNRTMMRHTTLELEVTFVGPSGDSLVAAALGEAMDAGDKSAAKAHSVAYRTLLLQTLCIPTDEPDPDEHSYERSPAIQWATPDQVTAVKQLSADLSDDRKQSMREFVEGNGIDLKRMTSDQAAVVLVELEKVSAPQGDPDVTPAASVSNPQSDDEPGPASRAKKMAQRIADNTPDPLPERKDIG
jgi:hypothetical protein